MIKEINVKNILKFTIPTILTMLFTSIYTMVDGIFVSNLVGESALSAVNIVYPIMSVILAIGLMLGTGGTAICAKLLGEGKTKEAKENFTLFSLIGLIVGIILSIVGYFNIETIIGFLGAQGEVWNYSIDYLKYILWSFPFLTLQVIFQSAFIMVNKPKLALLSMGLGGITNIILDYIFLDPLNMGIIGAAIATGIGSTIPAIIGIIYFIKRGKDIYFVKTKFSIITILKACSNGSSEMIGNIAAAVTTLLFNLTMIELVGNDGVAAITVILYTQFFLNAVFLGYSRGISPVISYNFGEKNKGNLRKIFIMSIKLILIFSILSTVGSIIFATPIANIFTDPSSNVFSLTLEGMSIFAISFLFVGFNIYASSMFTAYSNGKVSATISFLRTFVLITASILILPNLIGITGVWIAVPIAEAITAFISVIFIIIYRNKYWYGKDIEKNEEKELTNQKNSGIITINREFSTGGREIGKRLSETLKYAYYDQEIIDEIVKNTNLNEEYINKYSESKYTRNYSIKIANSFINYRKEINIDIHQKQAEIIKKLASKGNAVFVGRCADYILKDYNPFKVFIYSTDIEKRIERCYEKVPTDKVKSKEEIKKNILKIDKERKEYYEYITGQKRENVSNYNISIDTAKTEIKKVVEIVKNLC